MTKQFAFPVWFALLLVGCSYSPSPKSGAQECDLKGSHRCPDGYFCYQATGICWKNGDNPGIGDAGQSGGAGDLDGGTGPVSQFRTCSPTDATSCSDWSKGGTTTWSEVQFPSASQSYQVIDFQVSGRLDAASMKGTVLLRLPDESLEIFIPDLGSSEMWVRWRSPPGQGDWQYLAPMTNVE
jgi:hypothetical protein